MRATFQVCIPNTLRDSFDYFAKEHPPTIGARVWVPFRKKMQLGVVVGAVPAAATSAATKYIETILDETPLLSATLLTLARWVSDYYQSPLSEVLPLMLPKKYRLGEDILPERAFYQLVVDRVMARQCLSKRVPRQQALVDFLTKYPLGLAKKDIINNGFSAIQLKALIDKGIVVKHTQATQPPIMGYPATEPLPLNTEQAAAVATILKSLSSFQCFLLQGVTGSGKTEVYLQVIREVLAANRQVLILVPEIGLTPQLLDRFRRRFQEPMAVIHSKLSDTERQLAWKWAQDAAVKLVIGTRAAIFAPLPQLGLIVIDEEHDSSLKQMEGVRYSARDTALMRAYFDNIPIILGSATPSLESLHNCNLKKYTLLRLTQKALTHTPLHYQILDIRNQTLNQGLAETSLQLIREHLALQNQVLVFINRRGFAPILLCHQCGWMADCSACDAHLTLHRNLGRLLCHHCGSEYAIPTQCQRCAGQALLPIGTGTQRVFEYLSEQLPNTTMLRIDRDEVRQKHTLAQRLSQIHEGEVQLIVGTQMLAKGHHFPRLTLVVILDADNGFYNQDFRSLERLGQLLVQVAGRAGRAEKPGTVVIQTHLPQHPLLNTLIQRGYDSFAQVLLKTRQEALLPPFQFLALIRGQARDITKLLKLLRAIKQQLQSSYLIVLGPAPAPLARKAGFHRMQLLIKSAHRTHLKKTLNELRARLQNNPLAHGIRWSIDVDPIDLS